MAEPKIATKTTKGASVMACEKMMNFPMKPAVSGTPAMDNKETDVATAKTGSECPNPRKALKETSLLIFSTHTKHINAPTVAKE